MSFSLELADRTDRLLIDFEASDVYQRFFHSRIDPPYVRTVVRRLLLEVGSYGPWITSAMFSAVGRLSHLMSARSCIACVRRRTSTAMLISTTRHRGMRTTNARTVSRTYCIGTSFRWVRFGHQCARPNSIGLHFPPWSIMGLNWSGNSATGLQFRSHRISRSRRRAACAACVRRRCCSKPWRPRWPGTILHGSLRSSEIVRLSSRFTQSLGFNRSLHRAFIRR